MNFTLHVWRQNKGREEGRLMTYRARDVGGDMSFLDMLDAVNEELITKGERPIAFDSDCREGICGSCSLMINGVAHGPQPGTTACQLYMRHFRDGDEIYVEPWRARAFAVIRDLVVDRRAFDRIMEAGGYISANPGSAPDGNAISVSKESAEEAFEAASCIGCGACVAACPNASAMLFVAAKTSQLARFPQGQPERVKRAVRMVQAMDREGFGSCSNQSECEAVCPKEIPVRYIAELNREFLKAALTSRQFSRIAPPPPTEVEGD